LFATKGYRHSNNRRNCLITITAETVKTSVSLPGNGSIGFAILLAGL